MKTHFSVFAFVISMTTYAQKNETIIKIMPRGYHEKSVPLVPEAKWLSENKVGNLYSLPLDNMHCLVPDLKKSIPIPTKKLLPDNSKMPNKFPK